MRAGGQHVLVIFPLPGWPSQHPSISSYLEPVGVPFLALELVGHGEARSSKRFDGEQAATVPPGTRVPGGSFGKLGCGRFDRFWAKR